jgi:hypothetical protein
VLLEMVPIVIEQLELEVTGTSPVVQAIGFGS